MLYNALLLSALGFLLIFTEPGSGWDKFGIPAEQRELAAQITGIALVACGTLIASLRVAVNEIKDSINTNNN